MLSPECVRCSTSTLGYKRQFDDLIGCSSFLRRNSILRGVNGRGMSKFDGKPHSLPISTITCYFSPKKIRRITSDFRSFGESFSNMQLRPIFATNKPSLLTLNTFANPRSLFEHLKKVDLRSSRCFFLVSQFIFCRISARATAIYRRLALPSKP